MIGQTVSHYKILEELGTGGMGVVYRAEDLTLKRTVALKFLSSRTTGGDDDKVRLMHEAQTAAALNHPNICTVHEIDEHEGQLFIAMEFIEGESLKATIESGPLPLDAAVGFALQLAVGLRGAHEKNVVHRDVKSANIIVTPGGQVKIMDFGLAKAPGLTQLTREGTTVGTVAYMSPEQGRGDVVDTRSDIWSLGVVLYEMVSGRLPFKGAHEQAVMYSVLSEDPEPLTGLRSDVPMELERIVDKCLEKEPSHRYQGVDDLLVDLTRLEAGLGESQKSGASRTTVRAKKSGVVRWVFGGVAAAILIAIILVVVYPRFFGSGPGDPGSGTKKIAVLFFENLGPPDDEYFANGITDAITARLAVLHGLGVISRQSTIQYKGSNKSIHDIGEELGADYILEGTIQRERPGDPASRVRIIPQLISVSEDIHLWADTYDEDMTEVFRVQSSIAERVARALDVTLLETERKALEETPTENLEAYEYYLRGNEYLFKRYSPEISREAVQMYERATELDPEFAAAWAGLSKAYIWSFYSSYVSVMDLKTAANTAVDKARELEPNSPDVQIALGYYHYYGDHDFGRAIEHLERARSSRPNNVETLNVIAFIKRRQGEWDDCAALLEKSVDLNPRSFDSVLELGITYTAIRQYEKAERLLDRAVFLFPGDPVGRVFKILLYLLVDGDTARAKKSLLEASKFVEPALLGMELEPFVHSRIMAETYAELLSDVPPEGYGLVDTTMFHFGLAEMYHQLGLEEQARECWEKERVRLKTATSPVFMYNLELCLGLAYVGLGRNDDAVRIARDVVKDDPLSEDAFLGTFHLHIAALIFVRVGAYEEAIDQLELLLTVPSETSRALFRLDPAWDPLRENPRFQKLVEGEP